MGFNPNGLTANVMVTILTLVMVFILPALDWYICRRVGVSLTDGVSTNKNADKILHIRKILLICMFGIYLLLVGYVTMFSRSAYNDYQIHIALFEDLTSSIKIDFGILGFIVAIFKEGFSAAVSHIKVQNVENITQVYLNVCMFIPLGYLLPYIFDWYRRRPIGKTVITSFLASLLIENIQLITKRGFYDIDDIVSNTLGGFLGVLMFRSVAYVLTHPDWRSDLRNLRLWRSEAKRTALFPFFKKIHYSRTTVMADDSTAVLDFYIKKMGMYLARTIVSEDGRESDYLFEFGSNQLEVRCLQQPASIPDQRITLACNNSEYLKKRLEQHGITVSDYDADKYTGLRTFNIEAPCNTAITIIEE